MSKPTITNPEEAAQAAAILASPTGKPKGFVDKKDVQPASREQVEPSPTYLGSDYAWHVLGMAYWVVGLDRSAFDLFATALNKSVPVKTYRAESPIFTVQGTDGDPVWSRIVQGIDHTLNPLFVEHLESYEFRRPQGVCSVRAETMRVADPFAAEKRGVTVTIWLPYKPGRAAQIIRPAGLTLETPVIGFVDAP